MEGITMPTITNDEKREKWAILCGTGMDSNYLTSAKVFDATEMEMFEMSPEVTGYGYSEVCGQQNSFPIKLTPTTKILLKNLVNELKKL